MSYQVLLGVNYEKDSLKDGLEMVALTKIHEEELKMLRFSMDRIRNELIRGTAQVEKFGDKLREACAEEG